MSVRPSPPAKTAAPRLRMRVIVPLGLVLAASALAGVAAAAVEWTDVADAAGVQFRTAGEIHVEPPPHEPADLNWPGFPEIMGGGACWADFDGDGYDDLYLVNQRFNEGNPAFGPWANFVDTRSKLYINQGDGTFVERSTQAGVDVNGFGYGCSAADYDGDGCVDLLVTNFGPSYLFRNACDRSGTFSNTTAALGAVGQDGACGDFACFSTSSAWADYDRDGDLDAYIGNYVDSFLTDNHRGPGNHIAQLNFLLRNNGDGTFAEVAQAAGCAGYATDADGSKTLGVAWFDYDLDGWQDLFVSNDMTPTNLFRNNGDGTFSDTTFDANIVDSRANMGVAVADYDNDGYPDVFITHYTGQDAGFYRNNGDGTFEDRSGEDDLSNTALRVGWGDRFADFDRDGWKDIIAANGHTEWSLDDYDLDVQVFHSSANLAPGAMPWDRTWTDVTASSGPGVNTNKVHRGAGFGDYDLDGNLDIALNNNANETAQLLRGTGNTNHWLYLDLVQPGANRLGVGARIVVEAGGLTQTGVVHTGTSYLSQSMLHVDFGLGAATKADTVTIHWPTGAPTVLQDLPADRIVRVDRATGTYVTDTLSPLTSAVLSGLGQSGWFRSSVTASLAATDRAVGPASGVASSAFARDGGAWQPWTGVAQTFSEEGVRTLHVRSVDAVGNAEPTRESLVRIDLTPPTPSHSLQGTVGDAGWFTSSTVKVSLGMSDALSGPGSLTYRVDGGAWTVYSQAFDVGGDGTHVVEFIAEDVAGNAAPLESLALAIDATLPSVEVTQPGEGGVWLGLTMVRLGVGPAVVLASPAQGFGPIVAVVASASDAASGLRDVRFLLDGAPVASDASAPYGFDWDTRTAASGFHVLTALARDGAGNVNVHTLRILLVSGTMDGVDATLEAGPALHLGFSPLDAMLGEPLRFLGELAAAAASIRVRLA